jgi:hypothetical protein
MWVQDLASNPEQAYIMLSGVKPQSLICITFLVSKASSGIAAAAHAEGGAEDE